MNLKKHIFITLILLLSLTGCTKSEPLVWEVHTGLLQEGVIVCDYDETTLNGVTYRIQKDVWSKEEQEQYVENVDKFINEFGKLREEPKEQDLTISIADTALTQTWQGEVYLNVADANALQGYVDLFLACHEDDMEQGLAYGITAALCEKYGLCEVPMDISKEALAEYFSEEGQLYLLDFTLPMFETHYFDEEIVTYVQAAAVSLVDYIEEQDALQTAYQLCITPETETLTEWKNDWLASLGAKAAYEPFALLPFTHNATENADEYPYELTDNEANWYFYPADVKEYGYKAFMEEYLTVKELMELDLPEVRELFDKYLPEEVPKIDIWTAFYEKGTAAGRYYPFSNHMELYYDWQEVRYSLVHEYVHYLTLGVNKIVTAGICAEGVAEEAATYGCENRLCKQYWNNHSGEIIEEIKDTPLWDKENETINIENMNELTAAKFYSGNMEGVTYLNVTGSVAERSGNIQAVGQLSYPEMASLTHYLVELYGRDAVYEGYRNFDSFEELIGKDFLELYEEWGEWNKEQCENLGILR